MSQHIDGAVKAAKKIMEEVPIKSCGEEHPVSIREIIWDECKSLQIEQDIATIIDQETAAPDLLKLFAERDRLREALKLSIHSGPMKIMPSPETFKTVEELPETTMLDFRMSVHTYKKIQAALAKAEPTNLTTPERRTGMAWPGLGTGEGMK